MSIVGLHLGSRVLLNNCSGVLLHIDWCPEKSNEASVLPLHLIEGLVQSLLLGDEHSIDKDGGG